MTRNSNIRLHYPVFGSVLISNPPKIPKPNLTDTVPSYYNDLRLDVLRYRQTRKSYQTSGIFEGLEIRITDYECDKSGWKRLLALMIE